MKRRAPLVEFRAQEAAAGAVRVRRREGDRFPFHAPAMHGHRFFVLTYLDSGRGTVRLPDRSVEVAAGHAFVVLPGELHDTTSTRGMGGWILEFTPESVGERGPSLALAPGAGAPWLPFAFQRALRRAFVVVPVAERRAWRERFLRLEREVQGGGAGSREAVGALLQLTLVDFARLLPPEEQPAAAGSPLAREVLALLAERYAEPRLSLAAVARAVGRSASHVTAVVRAETGMTVLEWLTERRLAEARHRLQRTDEDIAIVAERVGYLDPAWFSRLFRRRHGLSPRAYRSLTRPR